MVREADPARSAERPPKTPEAGRVLDGLVLRTHGGRLSLRLDGRALAVSVVLLVALAVVMGITLTSGDFPLPLGDVLRSLVGEGSPGADFIIYTLRLPRLLTAVFVGAALAASGAILQTLTRNPLGSPDIIGFTNGSATGALLVIIVLQGSMTQIALGALAGGLVTAVAVYLLAYTRGVQGFRLVVVGIGVSAMLLAANSYLITRARLQEALAAQSWLIGSLHDRGPNQAAAVGIGLAILLPLGLRFARRLSLLEMGDDAAKALGVNVERTRFVLLLVSVTLAAIATAATGPIWFIALAAPQLARRLTRSSGPGLLPAAFLGAVLLAASDLAVQRILPSAHLPVGTATGIIGGLYLVWLLATEARRSRL
ncbi:FecCD family ABC transporter permease [Longimycelium tulufanense]|uniref:FecCD family ABC transporter permease n=1 Tax=Longimycelium tulufanense TaxID=907463 RepID=UPI0035713164